ncbi:hypothetical protein OUZ56_025408 [Daphnia magna]|uniref:Uncharacterized protein n=1 Tax=Daphnia magna TaxID=35525 RepID=A0ABQ9ZJS6_9CRUS|nr:hypothetical protein OUZ56_025408 [Daphnia magna]
MRTATQRVGHHHYRYGTPVSAEEERERKKRTSRNVIQEKENNLTKAPLTAFVMAAADRREKREADGRDHRIWVAIKDEEGKTSELGGGIGNQKCAIYPDYYLIRNPVYLADSQIHHTEREAII